MQIITLNIRFAMEFRFSPGCRFPEAIQSHLTKHHCISGMQGFAKLSHSTSKCYTTAMSISAGGGWGRFLRPPCYQTAQTSSITPPSKPDYKSPPWCNKYKHSKILLTTCQKIEPVWQPDIHKWADLTGSYSQNASTSYEPGASEAKWRVSF